VKFAIIQSEIANRHAIQSALSVVSGVFWEKESYADDDALDAFYDGDNEDYAPRNFDEVDMKMARLALNGFLKARSLPETF